MRLTPIIFLTAYERTDLEMFRGYSVGGVDFLFKPVESDARGASVEGPRVSLVDLHWSREQVRRQAEQLLENEPPGDGISACRRAAPGRRGAHASQVPDRPRGPAEAVSHRTANLPGRLRDRWGTSHPAELTGGDYFDYFPLPGGGVGVAVGDVCGHGFGPALLMATTRAYLRALALNNARIGDILTLGTAALAAGTSTTAGRFVTLFRFLARLDPAYAHLGLRQRRAPARLRPRARRKRSVAVLVQRQLAAGDH